MSEPTDLGARRTTRRSPAERGACATAVAAILDQALSRPTWSTWRAAASRRLGSGPADPHERPRDASSAANSTRGAGVVRESFSLAVGSTSPRARRSRALARSGERLGGGQQLRGDHRSGAPDPPGVRRAHRDRPDARILVTGCAAELDRAACSRRCRRCRGSSETRTSSTPWRQMTS